MSEPVHYVAGFTIWEILVALAITAVLGVIAANVFITPVAISHGGPVAPCLLIPFAPHHWMVFGVPAC